MPNCVTQIQLLIRDNKLITIVTSRSLAVKTKLKCDIETAKRISEIAMRTLNVDLEYIKFNVGSCHFYI